MDSQRISADSAKVVSDRAMRSVMNKDREAWLDCFAPDAVLRDPVGGSPLDPRGEGLRGRAAMARFWDLVVAPADTVTFTVREEYPSGCSIAKVATVELSAGTGGPIRYDGVFVYDVDDRGQITRLCGYFTPPGSG